MESVVGNQRASAQLFHKIGSLTLSHSPPASNSRRPPILLRTRSISLIKIHLGIAITWAPLNLHRILGKSVLASPHCLILVFASFSQQRPIYPPQSSQVLTVLFSFGKNDTSLTAVNGDNGDDGYAVVEWTESRQR